MTGAQDDELGQFQREVERLAARIGAPAASLPTYGKTEDFARPHIEYAGGQYYYVVVERGEELERYSSSEPDEILCHVFDGVTFSMACTYEARHRRRGEDPRRQMFEVQSRLLGELSPKWQRRVRTRLDEVLRQNPFRDTGT
jgi:hypothetical protein